MAEYRIPFKGKAEKPIVLVARHNEAMGKWEAVALVGNFDTREDAIAMCNKFGEFLSWNYAADVERMKGE